jgi:nucleoside-diphosphate-sugar epimerase
MNKKIALVGGAGFIGHNLALHLKSKGAEVVVIDGLSVNNLMYLHSSGSDIKGDRELYIKMVNSRLELFRKNKISLIVEDARKYNELSFALQKVNPDVVICLSAVSHANESNKNPFDTFDHSLRTLENALDWSRTGKKHFIYFSSSMVYGHFTAEEMKEDDVCTPIGIYGNLKIAGEQMVKAYSNVFDLPYTIVRPSALYGERCISRRVGQIFIENAIHNKPITISGQGDDKLDFTYIGDLVQGIEKVIMNPASINQTFNLTYGKGRSISDLADIVKKNFPKVEINYNPKDNLTPDRGTLSILKAQKMIGYEPCYPIEVGYQNYIDWYKDFFNGV